MPFDKFRSITIWTRCLGAIFCLVSSSASRAGTHTVSDYVTRIHQDFKSTDELEIAVWLHRNEFLEKKEQVISKLIQKQPDSIYGHFLMTQLQIRKYLSDPLNVYQLKLASDLAQQTIELGPQKDFGYVAVAQILDLMGQSANAQKILDIADPTVKQKTWRLSYYRGILQSGRGQHEAALKSFAISIDAHEAPKDLIHLAMINTTQEKYEGNQVIENLTKLERQYKSSLFSFAQANALANQGQYKAAHEKYSALYSLDPQNFEAIVNDVSVLEKMQNTNAAYDLAKKTMTAYNSRIPQALRTSLHQHLGLFAIKKGMAREAEEHLITAMDFSENKFQILAGATEEYRKRKMYKELLSLLDKLNISNAGYALQYAIKGETLSENMQQHLEAVDAFEAAITLDPSRSEFYNGMGLAFFRMKDFKRALISFNVAAKVDPRDSVAHYNEACAFARLGQSSKALAALRTAVGLDPRLKEQAKVDSDLTSLKNTADFAQIIQSHEKQASATEVQRQRPKSSSQDIILINE